MSMKCVAISTVSMLYTQLSYIMDIAITQSLTAQLADHFQQVDGPPSEKFAVYYAFKIWPIWRAVWCTWLDPTASLA